MKPNVGDKVLIEAEVQHIGETQVIVAAIGYGGHAFKVTQLRDPRVYEIGQACIEEFKAARAYVDSPSIEAVERHIAAKKQRDRLTSEYLDDEKAKA